MNPIRILLCHREEWYRGEPRIDGQFAYPVPQFEWRHHILPKAFKFDLARELPEDVDVVWFDEGKFKSHSQFLPNRPHVAQGLPPVVMWALYPTLTPSHYRTRLARAKANADLVLLDHDDLGRWQEGYGPEVRRLAYSVNERYYRDRGLIRDIDVGFYCIYAFNKERPALDEWLEDFCRRKGYRYATTKGKSVGTRYAELLARTKVVVHLNRTPKTRPPRIFDCGACRTALLSNPMPAVSGEHWQPWVHYVPFDEPHSESYERFAEWEPFSDADCEEVIAELRQLLDFGYWREVAENAHQHVLACHTWAQRAKELYGLLLDVFPHLREGRESWMYE